MTQGQSGEQLGKPIQPELTVTDPNTQELIPLSRAIIGPKAVSRASIGRTATLRLLQDPRLRPYTPGTNAPPWAHRLQ